MKRYLAVILTLALTLTGFTACGNQSSDSQEGGGTVILQTYGDVMSFNPDLVSDDNYYLAAQNIFNRLAKLDANCNVIPDLAESWEYSEDGKELTFHLKENAKWHDGEPLTAEDVKYTFEYIKNHETCPFYTQMTIVDSIEVVDDYTAVFHMNTADMSFVSYLSWSNCFVLPEHIFNNGQEWSENEASKSAPIGSGPFQFEEYRRGENMTLTANGDYHDGAPKLDKLIISIIPDDATAMQALINGELDWSITVPFASVDQMMNQDGVRLALNALPSPLRIVFNLKNDVVSDPVVRQAIAYCIDREEIVEKAHNNIMPVEYSAYPSMSWASNTTDTYPACDLSKAESILKDAGYEKDADGYYIRGLTIDVFESTGYPDTAKLIAANCKKAGIEMKVQVYEYNAWSQKVEVDRDFCIELQGGFMGPDPAVLGRFQTGGWSNLGSYSNARVDELLSIASAETDSDKRAEYYGEVQKYIVEELPYINIAEYAVYEGMSAKLTDVPMDGAGKWGWAEWSHAYYK